MTRYWFRQKTFGYGCTPITWEGLAMTVVSLGLLFGLVLLGPAIRDNGLRAAWLILGGAAVMVPFTWIAWKKTEGGWRWRSGGDD